MDWRDLMVRYIAHIQDEEGDDFVPHFGSVMPFSAEEVAEIERMAEEAGKRRRESPKEWYEAARSAAEKP